MAGYLGTFPVMITDIKQTVKVEFKSDIPEEKVKVCNYLIFNC